MKITKKKVAVIVVVVLMISILYKAMVINGALTIESVFLNSKILEKLYYISQIMAGILVAVSVLVAGWQYVLTAQSEIKKNTNERVQKAIDLSEYYKDHILDKYCLLFYVFERCKMTEIINTVKIANMNNFDIYELEENFTSNQLAELASIIESQAFAKAVVEAIIRYDVKINKNLFKEKSVEFDGEKKQTIEINTDAVINDFMNDYVCETLNNMEFFAMHFTHYVADETVIYQSLHKTYLEVVQVLYYNIAKNNKDTKKLYTNVIDLFNKWRDESLKQKQIEVDGTRSTVVKGAVCKPLK